MENVLYVAEAVITEDLLRRLHQGQEEIRFGPKTVVTPTGWDFIREHQLRVSRGEAPSGAETNEPATARIPEVGAESAGSDNRQTGGGMIEEVCTPQMVQEGRCEHPDRSYGCKTDEFGSGFAEASAQTGDRDSDLEALVQQITDLVMAELAKE
jgi:hypothetical protein